MTSNNINACIAAPHHVIPPNFWRSMLHPATPSAHHATTEIEGRPVVAAKRQKAKRQPPLHPVKHARMRECAPCRAHACTPQRAMAKLHSRAFMHALSCTRCCARDFMLALSCTRFHARDFMYAISCTPRSEKGLARAENVQL